MMTAAEHIAEAEKLYALADARFDPTLNFHPTLELKAFYVAQAQYHATMAIAKQGDWEDS